MKIVVAVRCYNEEKNIDRFMRGYDFADTIVVSDGGSTDDSVDMLWDYHQKTEGKVQPFAFKEGETINGHFWNTDAPHMNFVLDLAKSLKPDWLIFDDMDCVPNNYLRSMARDLLGTLNSVYIKQINAFRLYLWGDSKFFPLMNKNFDEKFTSLWAWRPDKINIHADESVKHGTLVGLDTDPYNIELPMCLLHKSWNPDTIQAKIDRYNALGLPMTHPLEFAGEPEALPEWAHE